MTFAVIIVTRDRAALLRRAVGSVLRQSAADTEVIVVDDGADAPARLALEGLALEGLALDALARDRLRVLRLPRLAGGDHGPAYARNAGVMLATADYVGFLDDDAVWPGEHLARVAGALAASQPAADLLVAPPQGSDITVPGLLRGGGLGGLGATVVRRAFFWQIGGFDENLRFECEHDFHLRAIDAAAVIRPGPALAPPGPADAPAAAAELGRLLCRLRVFNKALLFARHPALRAHARRHKAATLRGIARDQAARGQYGLALRYALQALGCGSFS